MFDAITHYVAEVSYIFFDFERCQCVFRTLRGCQCYSTHLFVANAAECSTPSAVWTLQRRAGSAHSGTSQPAVEKL